MLILFNVAAGNTVHDSQTILAESKMQMVKSISLRRPAFRMKSLYNKIINFPPEDAFHTKALWPGQLGQEVPPAAAHFPLQQVQPDIVKLHLSMALNTGVHRSQPFPHKRHTRKKHLFEKRIQGISVVPGISAFASLCCVGPPLNYNPSKTPTSVMPRLFIWQLSFICQTVGWRVSWTRIGESWQTE